VAATVKQQSRIRVNDLGLRPLWQLDIEISFDCCRTLLKFFGGLGEGLKLGVCFFDDLTYPLGLLSSSGGCVLGQVLGSLLDLSATSSRPRVVSALLGFLACPGEPGT